MAAYDVVSFNGTTLGSGTNYDAWLDQRDEYVTTSTIDAIHRRSAAPLVTGTAEDGRTITLHLANAAGSALTAAQFRDAVKELFDPRLNAAGERLLVIVGDDGSTDVQIGCYVQQIAYLSPGIDQYVVTLWAPTNYWQATALTTDSASPATVTNAGNTAVYPVVEMTNTNHVTRRACTVTGAGAGGGLVAYPVVFLLSSSTVTASNTFVFVEGVSVPCFVDDPSTVNSRVWALIDTHADGTTATHVDVIYGAALLNPLCQTLDDGGMDMADAATTGNSAWEWNDWSVSSFPSRPGAWRPALTGNHSSASGASYQITSEGSSVVIALGASGAYDNSADSIRLHVGAKAGTTSALANLSRQTANLDGTNAQAYVRYRTAGSRSWQTAWSSRANATVTTSIDLDNAVEIAAGIENDQGGVDAATLTLSGTTAALTLASTPTVVVGAAENMDHYYNRNGSELVVGGRTIRFTQFFVPDGTLTIDCEARTITSDVAGPFYGVEDGITFSDPDQWAILEPGSTAITSDMANVAWTVKHRGGYT